MGMKRSWAALLLAQESQVPLCSGADMGQRTRSVASLRPWKLPATRPVQAGPESQAFTLSQQLQRNKDPEAHAFGCLAPERGEAQLPSQARGLGERGTQILAKKVVTGFFKSSEVNLLTGEAVVESLLPLPTGLGDVGARGSGAGPRCWREGRLVPSGCQEVARPVRVILALLIQKRQQGGRNITGSDAGETCPPLSC